MEVSAPVQALLDEITEKNWRYWRDGPATDLDQGQAILALATDEKCVLVVDAATTLVRLQNRRSSGWKLTNGLKQILSRLLRSKLPFTPEQLAQLMDSVSEAPGAWQHGLPIAGLVRAVERSAIEAEEMPQDLRRSIKKAHDWAERHQEDSDLLRVKNRLAKLLESSATRGHPDAMRIAGGPWGDVVRAWLQTLDEVPKQRWRELLVHAEAASGKARPTRKWLREARPRVEVIGCREFRDRISGWLDDLEPGHTPDGKPSIPEANSDLLKGLIWCTAVAEPEEETAHVVGGFGELCFRKIRDWGPRSTKLGNASVAALGAMSKGLGVAELSRLQGKVRYASARKQIARALDLAAKVSGMSRADLEELAVPRYGLEADGTATVQVGEHQAILRVVGTEKAELVWRKPSGRIVKSVPKAVRMEHEEEVRELRARLKQIRETSSGQAKRIERLFLARRLWSLEDWRERYFDHPLLSNLARRLIWRFRPTSGDSFLGLYREGEIRGRDGATLELGRADEVQVSLWHPCESGPDEVLAWRVALEEAEFSQPFKQAHREIYLLTDAERETATYSNRFAAHILRQHQFLALCQQRDWKYTIQGAWDSHNVPTRRLEAWDLDIEFWVDPAPTEDGDDGYTGFRYLATDQVRFYDLSGAPLELEEIDPLVFSEGLRDVDLFVGVASVGNDPSWEDQGQRPEWGNYWRAYSFGELSATAQTRRDVLSRLLPRLKIADQCRLEDRYLVVEGSRRTYRIHLGSGNIQMEPNQQYLCIVADHSKTEWEGSSVRLPFEGDSMLSLILSKTFLLADDHAIEDKTILSQIRR